MASWASKHSTMATNWPKHKLSPLGWLKWSNCYSFHRIFGKWWQTIGHSETLHWFGESNKLHSYTCFDGNADCSTTKLGKFFLLSIFHFSLFFTFFRSPDLYSCSECACTALDAISVHCLISMDTFIWAQLAVSYWLWLGLPFSFECKQRTCFFPYI